MKALIGIFFALRLHLLAISPALFLAGAALNQSVLIANGDKFPVMMNDKRAAIYPDGYMDELHVVMTPETKLNWLGDIIDLHNRTESVGDVALQLGWILLPYFIGAWLALTIRDLRTLAKTF